jgi:hypothetical protein
MNQAELWGNPTQNPKPKQFSFYSTHKKFIVIDMLKKIIFLVFFARQEKE